MLLAFLTRNLGPVAFVVGLLLVIARLGNTYLPGTIVSLDERTIFRQDDNYVRLDAKLDWDRRVIAAYEGVNEVSFHEKDPRPLTEVADPADVLSRREDLVHTFVRLAGMTPLEAGNYFFYRKVQVGPDGKPVEGSQRDTSTSLMGPVSGQEGSLWVVTELVPSKDAPQAKAVAARTSHTGILLPLTEAVPDDKLWSAYTRSSGKRIPAGALALVVRPQPQAKRLETWAPVAVKESSLRDRLWVAFPERPAEPPAPPYEGIFYKLPTSEYAPLSSFVMDHRGRAGYLERPGLLVVGTPAAYRARMGWERIHKLGLVLLLGGAVGLYLRIAAVHRSASRALLALVTALALASPAQAGGDLAPRKGWRVRLPAERIQASVDPEGAAKIPGLSQEEGAPWPALKALGGEVSLALALPEAKKEALLVALEVEDEKGDPSAVRVSLAGLASPGAKPEVLHATETTRPEKGRREGPRQAWLVVPGGRFGGLRLTLGEPERGVPRVKRLRIFRLDPRGRNDAWLFVGASLSVGAIDPDRFADELARRAPGFEPLVVNEAVVGWSAAQVLEALPAQLERYPFVRYVCVDIGGNEVTSSRPYPGGAERLKGRIASILRTVAESGRIPILERLSYRAYKKDGAKGAVPPEENGSLPYVQRVYDPLIAEWCPAFFDRKRGQGLVDLYSWFRDHPDELAGDGIHLGEKGNASFRRVWAEGVAPAVYGDGKQ